MASLRDIKTRIGSVKNTKQITNAMKMVSAAKLRRATEAATNARPYQEMLMTTLGRLSQSVQDEESSDPLMVPRNEVKRVLLVLIGSNRGLCGGFNATLGRRALDWIAEQEELGREVVVWAYGKKLRDFSKARKVVPAQARIDLLPAAFSEEAVKLGLEASTLFKSGEFDQVILAYNRFVSTLVQEPEFLQAVPISIQGSEDALEVAPDYEYEPSQDEILSALLPLYLRTMMLQCFLETEAGEQAARMTAMDNATKNASDLINDLTLVYNRGRQAAITKELIEIVSGAEAL